MLQYQTSAYRLKQQKGRPLDAVGPSYLVFSSRLLRGNVRLKDSTVVFLGCTASSDSVDWQFLMFL